MADQSAPRAAADHSTGGQELDDVASVIETLGPDRGFDLLLPFLERMRREGAVVVLKIDGVRGPGDALPYMALVSNLPSDFAPIRVEGASLVGSTLEMVRRYAARLWTTPPAASADR